MRGPQVLRQLVARWVPLAARQKDPPTGAASRAAAPRSGGLPPSPWAPGWLRVALLGCLVGGFVGGTGPSCIRPDPEYCETRAQCPYADTPLGPMQLFCHSTRHVCLLSGTDLCTKDEECPDPTRPRCELATNACTSCRVGDPTDTSCAHFAAQPLCGNANDGSGTTLCLACRNNLDCPSSTPICDNQQCRKCVAHSDCEGELTCDDGIKCTDSLVCIGAGEVTPDHQGSCAQNGPGLTGRVIYVNNLDPVCTPPPPDPLPSPYGNQFSTPQCTLPHALALAHTQNRRFIRVVGKAVGPLTTPVADGAAYTFIGAPAKNYPDTATVESRGLLFSVSGTSSLTLDQLVLSELNHNATVVGCSGNSTGAVPRLTLRRSILRGSMTPNEPKPNQAAVSVINCTTLIDGNIIGVAKVAELKDAPAHGQGISIADSRNTGESSYLIQNNLIAGNIGVALNLQGTGSGTPNFVVRFNTIVGNGRGTVATQSGAVFCDAVASTQEFSHSIVVNNSTPAGGSQFLSPTSCGVKDIVVGLQGEGATLPAFIRADAQFDDQFRLLPGSACCIDQVTPSAAETLPSQDLFGTKRPQGTKWDIGAVELKQ